MRWWRWLMVCLVLACPHPVFADGFTWDSGYKGDVPDAVDITTDTSSFNNSLSSTDTTVQTALDTLDNLTIAGDAVTVNSTAAANANFLDNLYIDWALDAAATPDDVTAKFNYPALSGNHALLLNEAIFGQNGLIFEGATADDIELYLSVPDPATTDKTLTLPNATDTLVGRDTTDTLTNKTLTSPTLTTPALGAATATTLDTGQGANELYAMDQNVRTTDAPTFTDLILNTAAGGGSDLRWAVGGTQYIHAGIDATVWFLSNIQTGQKILQVLLTGGAITLGDSLTNAVRVITDGIGDEEFTVPPQSIGSSEMSPEARTFTRCAYVENLAAADDNKSMGSFHRPVTVLALWCNHNGTPTTVGQFTLEDGAGNAMTHTTAVCTPEATPANPIAVTAGGALTSQEVLRFDVSNAVSPETDDYSLCVRYRYD